MGVLAQLAAELGVDPVDLAAELLEGTGEASVPNYLTVDPSGLVGANFTGVVVARGFSMDAILGTGADVYPPPIPNSVRFTAPASTFHPGLTAVELHGVYDESTAALAKAYGSFSVIDLGTVPIVNPAAQLWLQHDSTFATNKRQVRARVRNDADTARLDKLIIGSDGSSDFVQVAELAAYRDVVGRSALWPAAQATGTYALRIGGGAVVALSGTGDPRGGEDVFYLDPAAYAAAPYTNRLRVAASALVGLTAPAANFTVGLYPVTAVTSSAAGLIDLTLGAVVAGSQVVFNAPAGNSRSHGESADFAFPAAGYYVLCAISSAPTAANSTVAVAGRVQQRLT